MLFQLKRLVPFLIFHINNSNFLERASATSFFFGFLANKTSVDKVAPSLTIEEERYLRELKVIILSNKPNQNLNLLGKI